MGNFLDRQLDVASKFTEPKLPSGKLEVIASKSLLSPSWSLVEKDILP